MKLSTVERGKMLENHRGWALCTCWAHPISRFHQTRRGPLGLCEQKVGDGHCGRSHHRSLHGSKSAYCQSLSTAVGAINPRRRKRRSWGQKQAIRKAEWAANTSSSALSPIQPSRHCTHRSSPSQRSNKSHHRSSPPKNPLPAVPGSGSIFAL